MDVHQFEFLALIELVGEFLHFTKDVGIRVKLQCAKVSVDSLAFGDGLSAANNGAIEKAKAFVEVKNGFPLPDGHCFEVGECLCLVIGVVSVRKKLPEEQDGRIATLPLYVRS